MSKHRAASSQAVRLSNEMIALARTEGDLMRRSITEQLEHWARLGRALEQQPGLSLRRVRSFLAGEVHYDTLNQDEQSVALVEFEQLRKNRAPARALMAELAKGGYAVSDGRGGVHEEAAGYTARKKRSTRKR